MVPGILKKFNNERPNIVGLQLAENLVHVLTSGYMVILSQPKLSYENIIIYGCPLEIRQYSITFIRQKSKEKITIEAAEKKFYKRLAETIDRKLVYCRPASRRYEKAHEQIPYLPQKDK